MRKFNVGDRVKVVKNNISPGFRIGETGVVEQIDADGGCSVKHDVDDWCRWWSDEELELVEEASSTGDSQREFKVGDRVRLTSEGLRQIGQMKGLSLFNVEGEVVKLTDNEFPNHFGILLDDHVLRCGAYGVEWRMTVDLFELIAPADCSPPSKKPRRTVEKSTTVSIPRKEIEKAYLGDHVAHTSGIVEVEGKRVDAEAMFLRLLANSLKDEPARKKRRRSA